MLDVDTPMDWQTAPFAAERAALAFDARTSAARVLPVLARPHLEAIAVFDLSEFRKDKDALTVIALDDFKHDSVMLGTGWLPFVHVAAASKRASETVELCAFYHGCNVASFVQLSALPAAPQSSAASREAVDLGTMGRLSLHVCDLESGSRQQLRDSVGGLLISLLSDKDVLDIGAALHAHANQVSQSGATGDARIAVLDQVVKNAAQTHTGGCTLTAAPSDATLSRAPSREYEEAAAEAGAAADAVDVAEATAESSVTLLRGAKAVDQAADGNCLFRALAYALDGSAAGHAALRQRVAAFIGQNGAAQVGSSSTTLEKWVAMDHPQLLDLDEYARQVATPRTWGGAIELAAVALMRQVDVHVFERTRERGTFLRIGHFCGANDARRSVYLLYRCTDGAEHYDALFGGEFATEAASRAQSALGLQALALGGVRDRGTCNLNLRPKRPREFRRCY